MTDISTVTAMTYLSVTIYITLYVREEYDRFIHIFIYLFINTNTGGQSLHLTLYVT